MQALEQSLVRCLGHAALHLILIPSEACDVRCESCPQDPAASRMRPTVVRGVKNLLTDRADELDSLTLSWSGGEPLLALPVMQEVLLHASALHLAFPRMTFQSDVTTNAHLLDLETFRSLRALGVDRFQVPVEGVLSTAPGGHPAAGISAVECRTWRHLRALCAVPGEFVVEVRALVEAQRDVAALVEAFRYVFSGDARFRLIVRRPLVRPGDRTSLLAPPRAAGAEDLQAFPDAYVVRADGRIDACTWPRRTHPTGRELGHLGEEGRLHLGA